MNGNESRSCHGGNELEELGNYLRQLREAQKLTHEDIAAVTRVRPFILKAIEEGRAREVAGRVYARGFIKTYCEYLCAEDLWVKYEGHMTEESNPVKPLYPFLTDKRYTPPRAVFRRTSLAWVYWLLIAAVVIAAYLLWQQRLEWITRPPVASLPSAVSSDRSAADSGNIAGSIIVDHRSGDIGANLPSPISNAGRLTADSPDVAHPPIPVSPDTQIDLSWMDGREVVGASSVSIPVPVPLSSEQRAENGRFTIYPTKECWIGVYQGSRKMYSGVLKRDENKSFLVQGKTRLRVGNADAVIIEWNGVRHPVAGGPGIPATYYFYEDGRMEYNGRLLTPNRGVRTR